jgi:hypothetical protein
LRSASRSISSCMISIDLVQLLGLGVDLHAQTAGGLVDQVDGLVGQEAIGDVAMLSVAAAMVAPSVMRTP